MYYKCCVDNCVSKRQDIKMHQFPASEKRLQKWLECIGSGHLNALSLQEIRKVFVCHKHFEVRFIKSTSRLLLGAYPTLFSENEIASGLPAEEYENDVSVSIGTDHCYARRKKHEDHTYSKTGEPVPGLQQERLSLPEETDTFDADEDIPAAPSRSPSPVLVPEAEVEDSGGETLFSWQRTELIETDEPEEPPAPAPAPEPTIDPTLSLFVDFDSEPEPEPEPQPDQTVPSKPGPEDEAVENRCKDCGELNAGFEFWCVQCSGGVLCGACAGRPPHHAHYVLRAPVGAAQSGTRAVLAAIRQQLQNENLLSQHETVDDGMKVEVKDEPVENPPAEPDPNAEPDSPTETDPLACEPHSPSESHSPLEPFSPSEPHSPLEPFSPSEPHWRPVPGSPSEPHSPLESFSLLETHSRLEPHSPSEPHSPLESFSLSETHSRLEPHSPSEPHSPLESFSLSETHSRLEPHSPSEPHSPVEPHSPPEPRSPQEPATHDVDKCIAEKTIYHHKPFKLPRLSETTDRGQNENLTFATQRKLVKASTAEVKSAFLSHIERIVTTQQKQLKLSQPSIKNTSQTFKENVVTTEHSKVRGTPIHGGNFTVTSEPKPLNTVLIDLDDVVHEETIEYIEEGLESDIETIDENLLDDNEGDVIDEEYLVDEDDLIEDDLSDEDRTVDVAGRGVKRKNDAEETLSVRGPQELMVRALPSQAVVQVRPLSLLEIRNWTADRKRLRKD